MDRMEDFSDEILFQIISNLDDESLMDFRLVSEKSNRIALDIKLWSSLLNNTPQYTRRTFCFSRKQFFNCYTNNGYVNMMYLEYNRCFEQDDENEENEQHESEEEYSSEYSESEDFEYGSKIEKELMKSCANCPNCARLRKEAMRLRQEADQLFESLWLQIQEYKSQKMNSKMIINKIAAETDNPPVKELTQTLIKTFKAAMDDTIVYNLLSSSIIGYYKVLLTLKCWRETCKNTRTEHGGIHGCGRLTVPLSPFCVNCRYNYRDNKSKCFSIFPLILS